jgi:hypothetical protein
VITAPQSIAARSLTDLATVIHGGRIEKGGKLLSGFRWRAGAQQMAEAGG